MRTLWQLRFVLLLLFAVGCADENLVEVAPDAEPLAADAAASGPARIGMMEAASIYGMEPLAAMAESDKVLLMGEGSFSEASESGIVRCRDILGDRVTGLFVFARATVTGRFFFLDDMTGLLTRDRCIQDGDELMLEGSWTFTSTETGEAIWGSYTATIFLPDGSFTHHEIIDDGTGRFAGATGWIRGIGTVPPAGDGMFYGKGLIKRPQEVTTQGIVIDARSMSREGEISCVTPQGDPAPGIGPARIHFEGLATYLGAFTGVLTNDRCEVDFRGFTTLSGIWTMTGADGTVLLGTQSFRFGETPRFRSEMIIAGGTGPFEQASGWIGGVGQLQPGGFLTFPLEGLIFLPRSG